MSPGKIKYVITYRYLLTVSEKAIVAVIMGTLYGYRRSPSRYRRRKIDTAGHTGKGCRQASLTGMI
jgi:uncharacterized membrane protein